MLEFPFRRRPNRRLGAATLRAAFVVGVLAAVGWILFDLATREINELHIHGALSEAERNEVGAAASAAIVAGRRGAADMVEAVEGLGWSHDVRAWRRWPDRMHVAVTREPLAARWGDDAYLTTSGEVVALPEDIAGETKPTLRAAQASGVEAMRLYSLLHGAATDADLAIVELAENSLGEWSVQLDNGVHVMLGASEVSTRFSRFLTVWASELAGGEQDVRKVDTRYPAGVAVAWVEAEPERVASDDAPEGRAPAAASSSCPQQGQRAGRAPREAECPPAEESVDVTGETLALAELVPLAPHATPQPPPKDN